MTKNTTFPCFPGFDTERITSVFESAANPGINDKTVKTVNNQDAGQSEVSLVVSLEVSLVVSLREHFLKTFALGTPLFDDHCCTSGFHGSKSVRHFQIKTQASQR